MNHPVAALPRWFLAVCLVLTPPLLAEIPAEQALGLYAQTDPAHRGISPYLGMVALKSGILANIRFFGHYSSVPRDGLPRHPSLPPQNNCPQDAVAAVIQYLFPSPEGIDLVHNKRTKDPIGELALKRETGLPRIMALLDAITHYRSRLTAAGAHPDPASGEAFREAVRRILYRKAGSRPDKSTDPAAPSQFERLLAAFPPILQQAVLEETLDIAGTYPANIVEIAFLAYAWQAADHVGELKMAFAALLSGDPAPAHPVVFDAAYYRDHLDRLRRSLADLPEGTPPRPDELALFLNGNGAFDERKGTVD